MIPAIIIARGGSKRLPRKNVLPFCGLPLVEWSILQAVCSHRIGAENTYLSTDDDEIASIGEKHNINIIRRPDYPNPDELSGFFINTEALIEIRKKRDCQEFICVLPTSPIRFPNDIDRNIEKYRKVKITDPSCIAVAFVVIPVETSLFKKINEQQMVRWVFDKKRRIGKECVYASILDIDYYLNIKKDGMFTDAELDTRWMDFNRGGVPQYYLEAEWYQEFDIDIQDNFEFCEILMKRYILKGRGPEIYEEYARGKL